MLYLVVPGWDYEGQCVENGMAFGSEEEAKNYADGLDWGFDDITIYLIKPFHKPDQVATKYLKGEWYYERH